MTSDELLDYFRLQIFDTVEPYLWSDEEAYRFMDDAYFQFARLTGGIADYTSDVTVVDALLGEEFSDLDPSILTVRKAYRADQREIQVVNAENLPVAGETDYGLVSSHPMDTTTGPLRALVIGLEPDKVRWIPIPAADEKVKLLVYRLPLEHIKEDGQEFTDVKEQHHIHLVERMKELAYLKMDQETYDPQKAQDCGARFRQYCDQVKREWDRSKHKPRLMAYGGL